MAGFIRKLYILQIFILIQTDVFAKYTKRNAVSEQDAQYWNDLAQNEINKAVNCKPNTNIAKNVIFFLGDGMGIPTLTAARILKGQRLGRKGEETYLNFEEFYNMALIKTYNVDRQVPDSAGTATAFLTGVKGNFRNIGVDAGAQYQKCDTIKGHELTSILQWSQEAGKDTGFITTTRVTHATPAGLYAKTVNRDWEFEIPPNTPNGGLCKDIASQLMEETPGKNTKLIMGGGRLYFTPNITKDEASGKFGKRTDGKDLIKDWVKNKPQNVYMKNLEDFDKWNPDKTDYALGLFNIDHMNYETDREKGPKGEPSLAQMVQKAIQMLKKGPNGFFLFIEGGKIDHGHHETKPVKALGDALAMEEAVQVALNSTNEADTLIIVTADHSHVMAINGYPERGTPIFGISDISEVDNMPYTTLMYTTGPGYAHSNGVRQNITGLQTDEKEYRFQTAVPLGSETHGGEDVAVYAKGPWAFLFHGIHEQNYIPHVLAFASCVGNYKDKSACHVEKRTTMKC